MKQSTIRIKFFFYLSVKRECAKDPSTKTLTTYAVDQKLHNVTQKSCKHQSTGNNFDVSMELCLKHSRNMYSQYLKSMTVFINITNFPVYVKRIVMRNNCSCFQRSISQHTFEPPYIQSVHI